MVFSSRRNYLQRAVDQGFHIRKRKNGAGTYRAGKENFSIRKKLAYWSGLIETAKQKK